MSTEYEESKVYELAVFYNTENFYSTDPSPPHKINPTASGLRNWDTRRFLNKLGKIAQVFDLIKEDHGMLPMLIGLSEVKGEKVLRQLVSEPVFGETYDFVHFESMDERGVDVALLYDKSKIEIISAEPISFFFEIDGTDPEKYDTTRDVLLVRLRYSQMLINVFVFHLPSKREKDVNKPKRNTIISDIKERILKIGIHTDEAVLLMGDFNENPDEDNLKNLVYDDLRNKILHNPFAELFVNKKFSTFHHEFGLLFDQILISDDFFEEDALLKFENAAVFDHQKLKSWDRKFEGRPFRTYAGTRYLGGYSDHFPVLVRLLKNID